MVDSLSPPTPPENTPATPATPPVTPAPQLEEWNDQTRDNVLAKYSNDPNALAQGYWNSTREASRKSAEFAAEQTRMSEERAGWVTKQAEWVAERDSFTSKVEEAGNSTVTAADFNRDVFSRVQGDLINNDGKVTDETLEDLDRLGFQGGERDQYVEAVQAATEARFTEAQTHAPQGTNIRELLKFINEDASRTGEESVFSPTEHNYLVEAARTKDYATVVPIVERKYLEWMAAHKPKDKITKAEAPVAAAKNFAAGSPAGDGFGTLAELDAAKSDPRYLRDIKYRDAVDAKANATDPTRFNDERMEKMYGPNWRAGQPNTGVVRG